MAIDSDRDDVARANHGGNCIWNCFAARSYAAWSCRRCCSFFQRSVARCRASARIMTRRIRVRIRNRQEERSRSMMETSTTFTWKRSSLDHLLHDHADHSMLPGQHVRADLARPIFALETNIKRSVPYQEKPTPDRSVDPTPFSTRPGGGSRRRCSLPLLLIQKLAPGRPPHRSVLARRSHGTSSLGLVCGQPRHSGKEAPWISAMTSSVVRSRANFRRQISKQASCNSGHGLATPSVTAVTR